jgi:hypothetical protein
MVVATVFSMVVLSSTDAAAQGRSRWDTTQNSPPPSEVVIARWTFGHNGWFGGYGWAHNYPSSDQNFNDFIKSATGLDIDRMSYRIVELGEDDVFDYPFAYISEPGEMQLTETEVDNLREFVNRGGFILMDDFDGPQQLAVMRDQVRRAFPDRSWVALDIDDRLFKLHFELDDLHGMDPYVPGGYTTYYAMHNDAGEIVIIAGHNNDLANFWDWYDQPSMPLGPATDAFRLGVNYVVYSLTH